MKLLTKITRFQLIGSGIVLIISTLGLFFVLKALMAEEINEQLEIKLKQVIIQISRDQKPTDPFIWIDRLPSAMEYHTNFSDTILYDSISHENELYHLMKTTREINNNSYNIKIATSQVEWKDLFIAILILYFVVIFFLLIMFNLIQRWASTKIWNPFFQNLEKLKSFSFQKNDHLDLTESGINEFTELNRVLDGLTSRLHSDYKILKEFTENASHEIQTPLTIIQSKLERLRQISSLTKEDFEHLNSLQNATGRLSRLNKHLLLLARLDNQQYKADDEVNIPEIVRKQFDQMKELFDSKNYKIKFESKPIILKKGSRLLIEILCSNLFTNILRYTPEQGSVCISIKQHELIFTNSGDPLPFPGERLFGRFVSGNLHPASNGLGLAICQSICMLHGWDISYDYIQKSHIFRISF